MDFGSGRGGLGSQSPPILERPKKNKIVNIVAEVRAITLETGGQVPNTCSHFYFCGLTRKVFLIEQYSICFLYFLNCNILEANSPLNLQPHDILMTKNRAGIILDSYDNKTGKLKAETNKSWTGVIFQLHKAL